MILFRIDGLPVAFSSEVETIESSGVQIFPGIRDVPGLLRQVRFSLDPRGGVVSGGQLRVQVADISGRLAALVAPAASPDARITDWQIAPTVTGQAYVRVSPTSVFSAGDILYAPLDTWEVLSVEPSGYPGQLHVQRAKYSALPDTTWKYQPYYQRGVGAIDLGGLSIGRALGLQGRLCTLWNDSNLLWIGFVDETTQHGAEWEFSCRWILAGWREKFSAAALPGYQVNTFPELGGYRWHQGTVATPDGSAGWPAVGGVQYPTVDDYTGRFALDGAHGVLCRDSACEWIPSPQNRATRAAMGDDGWHQSPYADTLCTSPRKLPPCGWIDGAGMPVNLLGTLLPTALAGSWLWVPDGIDSRCAKKVKTVGVSYIVFESASYNDKGEPLDGDPGYTGAEIWFQGAAIVEFGSLPELIFSLLVSTGTGNNGANDNLPGYLGFGLPAELVDATIYPTLYETRILGDLDGIELDSELQALGYFVTFANGRFSVKPADIPESYNATSTYTAGDVVKMEDISARWANIAPIRTITFKAGDDFSIIASTGAYSPASPAGGQVEISTRLLRDVPAAGHVANILRIQRWASSGSAVLNVVVLPTESPNVGDVVRIETPLVASSGGYGGTVTGVVVESGITGEFVLHIGPADPGRYLAPALVPVSYASGVLTVAGGALQFFEFPQDTSYVLVRLSDGAYEDVGACSVIDDTHVQVAIAPGTLDDRIFTVRLYGDIDSQALKAACAFCATTRWRKA